MTTLDGKHLITKNQYQGLKYLFVFYFILSALIAIAYLVAPLFGGVLFWSAVISYGNKALFAILYLWMLEKFYICSISKIAYSLITIYTILCLFLWYETYTALIGSIVFLFFSLFGYRKYKIFLSRECSPPLIKSEIKK